MVNERILRAIPPSSSQRRYNLLKKNSPDFWSARLSPGFIVRTAASEKDFEGAMAIRHRVFVQEQSVSETLENDGLDSKALHVVALQNDHVIGTGRLVQHTIKEGRIGRMAVDHVYRRQGVGALILAKLENEARHLGLDTVFVHAQVYVERFYETRGYIRDKERFIEAGIQHQTMFKSLL